MPAWIPLTVDLQTPGSFQHTPGSASRPRRSSAFLAACCWLILGIAVRLPAAETLLRYIPENAGLIVRLNDWQTHAPKIIASPFWEKLARNPTWQKLSQTRDFKNLQKFQRSLETTYGKSFEEFSKEMYGREIILAVFSGEKEGTSPWGLLLTRGENALTVARGVAAWKRTDPLFAENRVYKQISYQVCKPHGAKSPMEEDLLCYVVLDDVMVTSGSEEAIRKAIDIHTAVKESEAINYKSILTSEEFQWSQAQSPADAPLTIYFQPRHWDKSIGGALLGKENASGDFVKTFLRLAWKNCRAVSLALRMNQGMVAELSLRLSPEARQWWSQIPGGKPFTPTFEQLPQEAVVAVGGRIPGSVLSPILIGLFSQADTKTANVREILKGLFQGLDPLRDIMPALGPEWVGGYFHSSTLTDAAHSHSQYFLKTQFTDREFPQNGQALITLRQSMTNAARTGLHMHAFMDSRAESTVKVGTESSQGTESLWWLQTPQRHRWSVGLNSNTVWLASDPELIRRERSLTPANSIANLPAYRDSLGQHHPQGDLFLWVDMLRWQESDAHRIAKSGSKPSRWLVLEPFHTLWLTLGHDAETVKLGAGLQ